MIDMKRFPLILLLSAMACLSSCQKDNSPSGVDMSGFGYFEIALSGDDIFIETKGSAPVTEEMLSNMEFTISGITSEGIVIENQAVQVDYAEGSGTGMFQAGEYTINATLIPTATDGETGEIAYCGTSGQFTISAGEVTGGISINMAPANSRVRVVFDNSLFEFYSGPVVNFTSPRNVSVTSSGTQVYFPAGTASYSVSAAALANSGTQSFTTSAHSLNLSAGSEYTITVKTIPGGEIIFTTSGDSPSSNPTSDSELWNGLFS